MTLEKSNDEVCDQYYTNFRFNNMINRKNSWFCPNTVKIHKHLLMHHKKNPCLLWCITMKILWWYWMFYCTPCPLSPYLNYSRALTSLLRLHNSPAWPLTPTAAGCEKKESFLIWRLFPLRGRRCTPTCTCPSRSRVSSSMVCPIASRPSLFIRRSLCPAGCWWWWWWSTDAGTRLLRNSMLPFYFLTFRNNPSSSAVPCLHDPSFPFVAFIASSVQHLAPLPCPAVDLLFSPCDDATKLTFDNFTCQHQSGVVTKQQAWL